MSSSKNWTKIPKNSKYSETEHKPNPYIHVNDCVDAVTLGIEKSTEQVEIYNIGSEEQITVARIADITAKEMVPRHVKLAYTGGVDGNAR